ncbi:MAG TPA: GyrI-like domain-containing protein [Sedimentisphaerales bacterium]|nr:GyrI-like domain-containing protein [Sedimentisphaerales bacterium]HNU28616.1 GyrI-like domain-containing protein [Sedimentisphaerales bacterium]
MLQFDVLEYAEVEVPPVLAAQIPGVCGPDPAVISRAIRTAFDELMSFVRQYKLSPSGPPRTLYTAHGPQGVRFTVAVPVAAPPTTTRMIGPGSVKRLAHAKAMRFTHRGPYPELAKTYGQITEFLKTKGLMTTDADWSRYMPMWEEYLNDPQTTPPEELRTYIYLPTK